VEAGIVIDPILLVENEGQNGTPWSETMPGCAPFPWNSPRKGPPHNVEIELHTMFSIISGFAHRRLLGGKLTFWSWIDGRCRLVHITAWRLKA
jgi:hypothetical protein